jgi:hypothetical protein
MTGRKLGLFAVLLTFVVWVAPVPSRAELVNAIPGGEVIPMPGITYFGNGPQTFGPGVTWTSTSSFAVFGHARGGYQFNENGIWFAGVVEPWAAINNAGLIPGTSEIYSMTFSFSTPVSAVGGFINYALMGNTYASPVIAVYDVHNNLIESAVINFNLGGVNNSGIFYGFQEIAPIIGSFKLSDSYIGLTNLTIKSGPGTCEPPPSNMISWWTGDGGTGDIVNGNDGTAVGNVGFARGVVGQAFNLDGLNSYVNAGNPPMLQVSNGDFTVDAWVLFNALSNAPEVTIAPLGDMSIVDKMSAQYVNVDGWRLLKQDDNRFWFCLGGKDGNHCGDPAFTVFSTTTATTGVWYHVAAVKKANGLEIYVNGALEDFRTPLPDFLDTNAADLLIGASIAEGAPLNGLVDEVEVFNRALTADEIRAIYVAGSAGKCRELAVAIDIKPGTFPNGVKPLVKGTMPVAVLTTPEFNATRVDPATVTFGVTGTETAPVRYSVEDVDGDGDLDMLLQFTTAETGIVCGTTEAKLSGYNISGLAIVGKDSVTTVGCR